MQTYPVPSLRVVALAVFMAAASACGSSDTPKHDDSPSSYEAEPDAGKTQEPSSPGKPSTTSDGGRAGANTTDPVIDGGRGQEQTRKICSSVRAADFAAARIGSSSRRI